VTVKAAGLAVAGKAGGAIHPVSVEAAEGRRRVGASGCTCGRAPLGSIVRRVEPAANAGLRNGVRNILGSVGTGVEHSTRSGLLCCPLSDRLWRLSASLRLAVDGLVPSHRAIRL
jgi:hypothetical protein